jgi:hypothetical protein
MRKENAQIWSVPDLHQVDPPSAQAVRLLDSLEHDNANQKYECFSWSGSESVINVTNGIGLVGGRRATRRAWYCQDEEL